MSSVQAWFNVMSFGLKETWHRPGGSWPQYLTKATLGTPAAVVSCAVRMENGTEVEQLVGQRQALCPLLAGPLPMASASDMHRPLLPFFFFHPLHLQLPSSALTGHQPKDRHILQAQAYVFQCSSICVVLWGLGCTSQPLSFLSATPLQHCLSD